MPITGGERHARRLKVMSSASSMGEVGDEIFALAQEIETEARRRIGVRGRVPSRPGRAPKGDTGELEASIRALRTDDVLKSEVEATAPHAAHLEFGTTKMARRPVLKPAARKMKRKARAKVAAGVRKANRSA